MHKPVYTACGLAVASSIWAIPQADDMLEVTIMRDKDRLSIKLPIENLGIFIDVCNGKPSSAIPNLDMSKLLGVIKQDYSTELTLTYLGKCSLPIRLTNYDFTRFIQYLSCLAVAYTIWDCLDRAEQEKDKHKNVLTRFIDRVRG
jgi:hypothetical protein